jgi:hypothetical protein
MRNTGSQVAPGKAVLFGAFKFLARVAQIARKAIEKLALRMVRRDVFISSRFPLSKKSGLLEWTTSLRMATHNYHFILAVRGWRCHFIFGVSLTNPNPGGQHSVLPFCTCGHRCAQATCANFGCRRHLCRAQNAAHVACAHKCTHVHCT